MIATAMLSGTASMLAGTASMLAGTAWADDGYYHPNDVARASSAYASATEISASAFERAQSVSIRYADGLNAYEEALDLLGARAVASERERHRRLRVAFDERHAEVSVFASDLADAYDAAFSEALDRARAALAPDAVRCEREVAHGPSLPGLPQRTARNPECKGADHNQALAAAMDRDDALVARLAQLNGRPWPIFELPTDAQPLVAAPPGGAMADRWVDVSAFFEGAAHDALKRLRDSDDDALIPLQAALEEGADPARLAVEARAIAEHTAAARARLAEPVLVAVDRLVEKHGTPFGWCANPRALGGCIGTDATGTLTQELLSDRRVAAALR